MLCQRPSTSLSWAADDCHTTYMTVIHPCSGCRLFRACITTHFTVEHTPSLSLTHLRLVVLCYILTHEPRGYRPLNYDQVQDVESHLALAYFPGPCSAIPCHSSEFLQHPRLKRALVPARPKGASNRPLIPASTGMTWRSACKNSSLAVTLRAERARKV